MFLLECLGVMAAVFWVSALVAHGVMTSPAERALGPAVRAGFGFVFTLVFFCAAWQLASIGQAWILGGVLLGAYVLATRGAREGPAGFWREYRIAFALYAALALLFFLPLIISWTFGPFTEGGGDVSIYADTARFLTDRGLTEFGLPSRSPDDLRANFAELLAQGKGAREGGDSPYMNPPFAEYPAFRILITRTMSAFLYTPYAVYGFLGGSTNYNVYYGLQAFVYAALLLAVWRFFRDYGKRMAIGATLLVGASHSLVSIFYNTYSAHGIAMMICALTLAALAAVRLFTWAGLRTYGIALMAVWICYIHYLSVLAPIVALACAPWTRAALAATPPIARSRPRWAGIIAAAVFLVLFGFLAWAGANKSWEMAQVLLEASVHGAVGQKQLYLTYMGNPVPAFGWHWLAFFFGFLSQQHYHPFAIEVPIVMHAVRAGVVIGVIALLLSLAAAVRAVRRRPMDARQKLDVSIVAVAVLVTALHLALVRTSLYTQAKGAQNVLLCVYFAMLLPVMLWRDAGARSLRRALVVALIAFGVALAVPRAVLLVRLAAGFDRTAILEPSFFSEVERIRAADPDAFILFEPRISADLYTSTQAFYGTRMLQTRHLVLQRSIRVTLTDYDRKIATVPEFITPANLPHLWLLTSTRH